MDAGAEVQLVVFELAGERFGVEVARVREVIRLQDVTPLPRAPVLIEGVINLRGRIVPMVGLRRRLGLPAAEATRASRIVVVEADGALVGLVVDAVAEVARVPAGRIDDAATEPAGEQRHEARRLGGATAAHLDAELTGETPGDELVRAVVGDGAERITVLDLTRVLGERSRRAAVA